LNTDESTRACDDEKKRLMKEFHTKPFEELKTIVHEKVKFWFFFILFILLIF
jgi:hypothetical protein